MLIYRYFSRQLSEAGTKVGEANQTGGVPGISSGSVVDQGIFQQCQEYEGDTNVVPNIDGLKTNK